MPVKDLREWIEKVESMGELLRIDGANWNSEIGAITDLYQQKPGSPALLFDKIPGYPEGFRVLSNACMSLKRNKLSMEIPIHYSPLEVVAHWRERESKIRYTPFSRVVSQKHIDKVF